MTKTNNPINQTIALIGMRGSGKTVVGRALAKLRGGEHVDTDDVIVQRANQTIAEIFSSKGEAGFRDRERQAIEQVTTNPPAVISVGGGAVLDDRNVERLGSVATLVWLTAEANVLWDRISADINTPQTRPSLTDQKGLEEVQALLVERNPIYKRVCTLRVDTTGKTPEAIAQETISNIS